MTGIYLHHNGPHCTVGVDLGDFKCVAPHQGMDRVDYVDIHLTRGRLSMDLPTWLDVLRRSQEEIIAAQAKRRIRSDLNISGAAFDFGGDGA